MNEKKKKNSEILKMNLFSESVTESRTTAHVWKQDEHEHLSCAENTRSWSASAHNEYQI